MDLRAPLTGCVIPLEQVPDPVFAQKMAGEGFAIDPISNMLVAPAAGTIKQIHGSRHALTMISDDGVEILMHVGLETVALKGEGFRALKKAGDRVAAGETLLEFDADLIAQRARSLLTMILLPEIAAGQWRLQAREMVTAGQDVVATVMAPEAKSALSAAGAEIRTAQVRIELANGLHARPAALIAQKAKPFSSTVELIKAGKRANAKSVSSILSLEAQNQEAIEIQALGADAERALSAIVDLIQGLREEAEVAAASPVKSSAPKNARLLSGIGVSSGGAVGRVRLVKKRSFDIPESTQSSAAEEKEKLEGALEQAKLEIRALRNQVRDEKRAAIFSAHEELLADPEIASAVQRLIAEGRPAAWAWNHVAAAEGENLARSSSALLRERKQDLEDVGRRVLAHLLSTGLAEKIYPANTILIAENLTPSEVMELDRSNVMGFAVTEGGASSHVAILARGLNIPAIAGLDAEALLLAEETEILLDADRGEVWIQPTEEEKKALSAREATALVRREEAAREAGLGAVTTDGQAIEVHANVGGAKDAQLAAQADGVGLLRTEFMFLDRREAPTEEEQTKEYASVVSALGGKPVTIRTLDVGGDKPLAYLPLGREDNPFLGVRGIRVGLRNPALLREQLRAILKSGDTSAINVMFPMVASLEEFRAAKAIFAEEAAALGTPMPKTGVMIEVPSAALTADRLAPEADFFSIGTNDLSQYVLAADRGHRELSKFADGLHPAVLKLIQMTAEAGRAHGKWVGVCGGLAGDTAAIPVLVGLGVTELSVSPALVNEVKFTIRKFSMKQAQDLAARALRCSNAFEVRQLTQNFALGMTNENGVFVSTKNR